MASSPIAPVIPSAARSTASGRPGGRAGRPLPLASLLPALPGPGDVVYGFGRIDTSGRVADRAVTAALGWRGGDRLTLTTETGTVVARRDPGGMITVPTRPYIAIPAALRRRCGLRAGDRVLLAALIRDDALIAYPISLVHRAIRATGPGSERGGEQ